MKAIVYESNTGFTQRYAEMLSEKTGLPAYELEKVKDQLKTGDEVFFLGWIHAGKIRGYAKAVKQFSVKGAAAVGISIPDEKILPKLKTDNKITDIPFFYLQGGVAPEKLGVINRKIMSILASSVEKAGIKTEEDKKLVDVLRNGGDFIKEENLTEILAFIGENPK